MQSRHEKQHQRNPCREADAEAKCHCVATKHESCGLSYVVAQGESMPSCSTWLRVALGGATTACACWFVSPLVSRSEAQATCWSGSHQWPLRDTASKPKKPFSSHIFTIARNTKHMKQKHSCLRGPTRSTARPQASPCPKTSAAIFRALLNLQLSCCAVLGHFVGVGCA